MAWLEILNGPQAGQRTQITQETFFLGRDANNHLVLMDRTVSRKHAVINKLEGRHIISDLKSLKGLLINGTKKEEAVLEEGDEIVIGALRMRFYLAEKTATIAFGGAKKSREILWVGGIVLVLIAVSIGFYFLRSTPSKPPVSSIAPGSGLLEQHYQEGIKLYNAQDIQAAKGEWEKVLALDPTQNSVYSQKAAKLLESIPPR